MLIMMITALNMRMLVLIARTIPLIVRVTALIMRVMTLVVKMTNMATMLNTTAMAIPMKGIQSMQELIVMVLRISNLRLNRVNHNSPCQCCQDISCFPEHQNCHLRDQFSTVSYHWDQDIIGILEVKFGMSQGSTYQSPSQTTLSLMIQL